MNKNIGKIIFILVLASVLLSSNVLAYETSSKSESFYQEMCSSARPSITGNQSIANALCSLREGVGELKSEIEQLRAENQELRKEMNALKEEFSIIRKIVNTFQVQIIEIQKMMIKTISIFSGR